MRGRINILSPAPILHDPPALLGDLRLALSRCPELADYPARLAATLETDEWAVQQCLEALRVEGEVLF